MSRETVASTKPLQPVAWIACARERAPEGVIVETKTEAASADPQYQGAVQNLKRRGNLWWLPDDSMYVYFTPTHWRLL